MKNARRGRPPILGADVFVGVRLPCALAAEVDARARAGKTTRSDVLRRAAQAYVERVAVEGERAKATERDEERRGKARERSAGYRWGRNHRYDLRALDIDMQDPQLRDEASRMVVLRAAFRAKAKQAHPDHGGDGPAFQKIVRAYRRLSGAEPDLSIWQHPDGLTNPDDPVNAG